MFLALLLSAQTALAAEVTVIVDGEDLGERALAVDGVTYAPLVPLLEALGGCEAAWDAEECVALAETPLFQLAVPVWSSQILADGYALDTGGDAFLHAGRTYVPLRAVANLLGARVEFVDWDSPVLVSTAESLEYSEEDFYWLSRIISAESQGESLPGQIAVGNVVLNRVASENFPDTIKEVVFEENGAIQFEPVANGTVYQEPTAQSELAARLALNGASMVGDCMFFFAPALSEGLWIRENCEYYTVIGCHEFYR